MLIVWWSLWQFNTLTTMEKKKKGNTHTETHTPAVPLIRPEASRWQIFNSLILFGCWSDTITIIQYEVLIITKSNDTIYQERKNLFSFFIGSCLLLLLNLVSIYCDRRRNHTVPHLPWALTNAKDSSLSIYVIFQIIPHITGCLRVSVGNLRRQNKSEILYPLARVLRC